MLQMQSKNYLTYNMTSLYREMNGYNNIIPTRSEILMTKLEIQR